MTPLPAGGTPSSRVPIVVWKALASAVIIGCLGVQAYAVLRPSGPGFYPFLTYPMYSRSRPPGETYRVRELWGRTCDARPRSWPVSRVALGISDTDYLIGLGAAVGDRPAARAHRARLAALARARLTPPPCVLQVLLRTVPTSRAGVDRDALRHPRRTLLVEWPVDDPATARATLPRQGRRRASTSR
ncbi:MAG TPA: hypothetical protein VFS08_18745 [Gemmatimonadaceae bacterium]|nr:hypothetical protein [Gemmatimonadaceae bacterium]